MKLVITKTGYTLAPEIKRYTLIVAPFDVGANSIQKSMIEGKGELVVGVGVGQVDNLPVGTDGYLLIADSAQTTGVRWGTTSSGVGYSDMTNKSGGAVVAGDVVVFDTDNDTAFETTTNGFDLRVCGVAYESISANSIGRVATLAGQIVSVNCDTGAIARGEWLVSSATEKKAKSGGYYRSNACFAIALQAKAAGSAAAVQAMLITGFLMGIKGNNAYALGGKTTTPLTSASKFTVASATWAGCVSAAFPLARTGAAGLGYSATAGYAAGGNDGSAYKLNGYKMPFSTDATSAATGVNLPAIRGQMKSGYNASDRGYAVGGYEAANSAVVNKLTFATDVMSANLGTALAAARTMPVGISDGVTCYAEAGISVATSDKITVSSDTVSRSAASDLGASTTQGYAAASFQATAGYLNFKEGAAVGSNKVSFASGTAATVSSGPPADQAGACSVSDGMGLAWFTGDDGSPYTVSHKLTVATETYSADAGAVMDAGRYQAAYFNNGAY